MPTELERRAREILAAEFDNVRDHDYAVSVRAGGGYHDTGPVICAIVAALQAQQPDTLCEDCPPVGYPTDATRCDPCPRKAQKPGAQAVAIVGDDLYPGWVDDAPDLPPGTKLYTQPPSIPEPSEDDAKAAIFARNTALVGGDAVRGMLAALTTYTVRLRERIGGGA